MWWAGARQGHVRGQQVPGSLHSPRCCFPSGGPSPAQPLPAPGSPSEPPARPWAPAAVQDTHGPGVRPRGGGGLELSLQRALGSPVREALLVFLCLRECGSAGVRGPLGCTEAAERLHRCRYSAPRKVSACRGVPGSRAADGSHVWGTGCLPSGTLLPARPPHAVQGQASGLGQRPERAPLGPPAGRKARRKGPKDPLPGSRESETFTQWVFTRQVGCARCPRGNMTFDPD